MSLPHFFLADQVIAHEQAPVFPLSLAEEDAKHARALRLHAGEHIACIDSASDYFECEIVEAGRAGIRARIAGRLDRTEPKARITLVQGLAKGDKTESVIRAATELGADEIIIAQLERSVSRLTPEKVAKRCERWDAIAKSASMQSGRSDVPPVRFARDVESLAPLIGGCDAAALFWEEAPEEAKLCYALAPALRMQEEGRIPRACAIIGPEGGISAREVEVLSALEGVAVSTLGHRILRTETAGIAAVALMAHELGCL